MARMHNKWNKASEITLPFSGETVLVRRIGPVEMARMHGSIGQLQAAAMELTQLRASPTNDVTSEQLASIMQFAETVTRACLVDPVVVDRPEDVTDDDHQVYIGDIVADDRMAILNWLNGGEVAEQARSFRDETGGQDAAVEPLPDGEDAGAAAERPAASPAPSEPIAAGL